MLVERALGPEEIGCVAVLPGVVAVSIPMFAVERHALTEPSPFRAHTVGGESVCD